MARGSVLHLVIVSLAALLAAALAVVPELHPVVRAAAGSILVLVLPGYALASLLFPARELALTERVALIVGLSACVVIVVGFVLGFTGIGLRPIPWAIMLGGGTVVASAAAIIRRGALRAMASVESRPARGPGAAGRTLEPAGEDGTPARTDRAAGVRAPGNPRLKGLLIAFAVLLAVTSIALAREGEAQQPRPGFTQLWLLPAEEGGGDAAAVRVGIVNREGGDRTYRLGVEAGGAALAAPGEITLADDEAWETTISVPTTERAPLQVRASLALATDPTTPVRSTTLWLFLP